MKTYRVAKPCAILVALLVGPAFGLPPDRVAHYAIREDPTVPTSRVQYVLSSTISAQEQDGDWIGWEVQGYTITEKAVLGSDTVWAADFPFVDTSDGLWWVEHADPDNPIHSEFVLPAGVIGAAVSNDPAVPDLYFAVVGAPYAPPAGGAPYEVTGALNFRFSTTALPSDPPDDDGDDEPVDVPLPPQDPPVAK